MSFHIAHINEVYSNADGTVQFIEFAGDADGQDFWAGHSITSTNGVSTNTYNITTDLPSSATAGKSVLVATQGFAELGIVTPDYIIPNGFLFTGGGTVSFFGMDSLSYAVLPTDGTLSLNRNGATGINSPMDFAGNAGTVPGNVISGTDGADSRTGTAGIDLIFGRAGNDTLIGGPGNDTLDGGGGADTVVLSGPLANYTASGQGSGLQIVDLTGADGTDFVTGIERYDLADRNLAFDLGAGQAAGNTVRVIGAAFDAPTIQQHPDYVGIGLSLFDSGMSMLAVCQLVIGVLGNPSNEAFVNTVYQNLVGAPPSQAELNYYVGLLVGSGGGMTQAQLLEIAANAPVNELNINLVGLQSSGVEFV